MARQAIRADRRCHRLLRRRDLGQAHRFGKEMRRHQHQGADTRSAYPARHVRAAIVAPSEWPISTNLGRTQRIQNLRQHLHRSRVM